MRVNVLLVGVLAAVLAVGIAAESEIESKAELGVGRSLLWKPCHGWGCNKPCYGHNCYGGYGGYHTAKADAQADAYGPNTHTYTNTKAKTTPYSSHSKSSSYASTNGRKLSWKPCHGWGCNKPCYGHNCYGGYGGYHTAKADAQADAYGPNTHTYTNTKAKTTPYSSHSKSSSYASTNGRKLSWKPCHGWGCNKPCYGHNCYGGYGGYHTAGADAQADAYGPNTHTYTNTKAKTTPYSSHSKSSSYASTNGRKLSWKPCHGWGCNKPCYGHNCYGGYGGYHTAKADAQADAYGPNTHTYTNTKAKTTPYSSHSKSSAYASTNGGWGGRKQ